MQDYYYKYIKYKNKYINLLKNNNSLIGGLNKDNIEKLKGILAKYHTDFTPITYCDKRGFKQHNGECWHDTIQTLFCFSDALKNQVQKRLLNLTAEDIVEFAFLKERDKYLPYIYKHNESNLKRVKDKLIIYIKLLQQRLCMYLSYDESIKISSKLCNSNADLCPIINPNMMLGTITPPRSTSPVGFENTQNLNVQPVIKNKITRRNSTFISVEGSLTAFEITRNKDIFRSGDEYDGGTLKEDIILVNLLSFIFVDDPYVLIINYTNNLILSDETVFVFINSHSNEGDHATGFFKCNSKLFYYDDNHGIIEFNWIDYINYYNSNKEILKPVINISNLMKPFFMNINDNKYYILQENKTLSEFNVEKDVIFTIYRFLNTNKIRVDSEIDYINKNAINLLFIELENKTYQNIRKYIESGLNINIKYEYQSNILQYILSRGCNDLELIKYLIEKKNIDINYLDINGNNALMYVNGKNEDIIKYLIDKKCDINKINNYKESVLWNLLVHIDDNYDTCKYICQTFASKGQDIRKIVDTPDKFGNYLLNELTEKDYINIFKCLVNIYKVNTNVQNTHNKYSPIFMSIYYKSHNIFDNIITNTNNNNINFLNIKLSDGQTLLHTAVLVNNMYAIKKLYEMADKLKVNISIIKDKSDKLPFEVNNPTMNINEAKYYVYEKYIDYEISKEKDIKKLEDLKIKKNKIHKRLIEVQTKKK